MARNPMKDLQKVVDVGALSKIMKGGGISPEFMQKVTENQVIMQENQLEFEKMLKDILNNQKKILEIIK